MNDSTNYENVFHINKILWSIPTKILKIFLTNTIIIIIYQNQTSIAILKLDFYFFVYEVHFVQLKYDIIYTTMRI